MVDYKPLFTAGKRDKARRYVSPEGNIISRRQYIKLTEGYNPEQKAIRRYIEGKSDKRPKSAPKWLPESTRGIPIRWKVPKDIPYSERGGDRYPKFWQLMAVIDAQNVDTGAIRTGVVGYSTAKRTRLLDDMTSEAVLHALASLGGGSGTWVLLRITRRVWLRIVRKK